MPPPSKLNDTLVGQLFVAAGMPIKDPFKHKTWVYTLSRSHCQREYGSLVTSSAIICGYQETNNIYEQGAPLVGIHVNKDTPRNFYLVGLQIDTKEHNDAERDVVASFLDVRPYLNFINRNADFLIVRDWTVQKIKQAKSANRSAVLIIQLPHSASLLTTSNLLGFMLMQYANYLYAINS